MLLYNVKQDVGSYIDMIFGWQVGGLRQDTDESRLIVRWK